MWDILLPTLEDCVTLTKKDIQNKEIICAEYICQRWARVAVYEVLPFISGLYLGAFIIKYGYMVRVSPHKKSFDFIIDHKDFNCTPNCLTVDGRKLPVIVSRIRLAHWRCEETGHTLLKSPWKKTLAGMPAVQCCDSFPLTATVEKFTSTNQGNGSILSSSPTK